MKRFLPIVACVWFLTAGCAQLPVYRIPAFLTVNEVDSLAVAPFKTTSFRAGDAGHILADRLAAAMAANGTYDRVFALSDVVILTGGHPYGANAQAILTGTITHYHARSFRDVRHEPIDGDRLHHHPRAHHPHAGRVGRHAVAGTRRVVYIRNEAEIAVTAKLLLAETGEIIHATPRTVQAGCVSEGSPPDHSLDECLDIVIDELVADLVSEFAVTTSTQTIDPNKAMVLSDGQMDDDEWQKQEVFSILDEEMLVVIKLPDAAHLNVFDILVRRKDHPETLAAETISWDAALAESGLVLVFSPAAIAAAGGGPGEYEVVFYARDKKVMDHEFDIVDE